MGAEKFFNIKCRVSGMAPDCAVVVATVRAIKVHSGKYKIYPGKPLPPEMNQEDLPALEAGIGNLLRHVENVRKHGVPAVVAINRFPTDTDGEIEAMIELAQRAGASAAVVSNVHAEGGAGGAALAEAVVRACEEKSNFRPIYADELPIAKKIETVCREIYRADGVDFTPDAKKSMKRYEKMGLGRLPVCMAKTQYSFSDDPKLIGAPTGFRVKVREVHLSAGAGFFYALCGDMMTMPGLGSKPALLSIDVDDRGEIQGLF